MRSLSTLLLSGLLLLAATAFGQSLSIRKDGENGYRIDATTPPNTRYVLQASGDLQSWVDLNDEVGESFSYPLKGVLGARRYFRLALWTGPPPPINVLLIGDSTASDCCGWGQGLPRYFRAEDRVINYAMAWVSTKVFLRSAEFDNMLLVKPDYVLIQYGYMDSEDLKFNRGTTIPEFNENLRTIVQTIRGFNGIPILITPHASRTWDASGNVARAWEDRVAVVREVAADLHVYLLDLYQLSRELYQRLGPAGSAFMALYPGELVHFSPEGAEVFAGVVARALPPELAPHLRGELLPSE